MISLCILNTCQDPPSQTDNLILAAHTLRADNWSLEKAHQGRFQAVVQVFSWREIEPTRDEYHWEVIDQVVAGAAYYGLDLIVRLDQHPAWANSVDINLNGPPDRLADYGRFVGRVVNRYQGRIKAYIIWNEPNLALEWGARPPAPTAYVDLLKVGYEAVRANDPEALVVVAALAPTNGDGNRAMDDRAFLKAMYAAGAGAYFDVLGIHPYGFHLSPYAGRDENDGLVFARLLEWREIMLAHGDEDKPVWITELGWTVTDPPSQSGLAVSLQEQARYLGQALDRVRQEWPWIELFTVWNIGHGQDFRGYSLFERDGVPRLAYLTWQEKLRQENLGREPTTVTRQPDSVTILAEDARIHLGDTELSLPWWPLYAGHDPSPTWTGGFYLADPGQKDWMLSLEMVQQSDLGATILVNGHLLTPDMPQQDFTLRWMTFRRRMPFTWLRSGYNEVTISTVRLAPDLQHDEYVWNDFQFRRVWLRR